MIAFLDSSALVKMYVDEIGRPAVGTLVRAAQVVAVSAVAYPEVRAALARRVRDGTLVPERLPLIKRQLDGDWQRLAVVEASGGTLRLAGDLAEDHALRGFDAVHLACAVVLRDRGVVPVTFACWDTRLRMAAQAEGFETLGA